MSVFQQTAVATYARHRQENMSSASLPIINRWANIVKRIQDVWFQVSAALILTGSGAEWRVGAQHGVGVVGREGWRGRRQLVISRQAVLAVEDITGSSEPRSQPASDFTTTDIPLVQQEGKGLCDVIQRLIHVCYLWDFQKNIDKMKYLELDGLFLFPSQDYIQASWE